MIEVSLKSCDILYLSLALYEVANAKATVIIIPGLNEYKERYIELINYLNNAYLNVLIYDPRGHGKSVSENEPLGYISGSKDLVEDLQLVVNYTVGRIPGLPIYLIGDSLGALTALSYLDRNNFISKFALVSPLISKGGGENNLKMVKFLMNFVGKTKESSIINSILGFSKDEVVIKDQNELVKIKNDSLCYYNYKNISIYRMLELQNYFKHLSSLNNNSKALILTGMLDTNLSGKVQGESLIKELNKKGYMNTSFMEFPNMGHKILFETGRTLVYQEILSFFLS